MSRAVQSLLAIAVIAAVGLPLWYLVVARRSEPPPAPPRDVGPASVVVREVRPVDFPLVVEVYGTLLPARDARLAPEQSGRVTSVRETWRPGARVAAGDELLRLDDTLLALELERAEALGEEARHGLAAAGRERALTEELRAGAAEALAIARREDDRLRELLARSRVSESQADRSRAAVVRAEQEFESARAAEQTAVTMESAARARAEQADVAVRLAEEALARTRLVAPFDGRLADRPPAVGTFLHAGTPVARCLDLSAVHLAAQVPEDRLALLREGLEADVTFPSRPGLRLTGTVHAIAAHADATTRSATVEIRIPNPGEDPTLASRESFAAPAGPGAMGASAANGADGDVPGPAAGLVAGLFATARIRAGVREDVLWIDRRQLAWRGERPHGFVVEETPGGGTVVRERELRLGLALGEGFAVTDGLEPGERVVASAIDRLRDGAPVLVRAADAAQEAGTGEPGEPRGGGG